MTQRNSLKRSEELDRLAKQVAETVIQCPENGCAGNWKQGKREESNLCVHLRAYFVKNLTDCICEATEEG